MQAAELIFYELILQKVWSPLPTIFLVLPDSDLEKSLQNSPLLLSPMKHKTQQQTSKSEQSLYSECNEQAFHSRALEVVLILRSLCSGS